MLWIVPAKGGCGDISLSSEIDMYVSCNILLNFRYGSFKNFAETTRWKGSSDSEIFGVEGERASASNKENS